MSATPVTTAPSVIPVQTRRVSHSLLDPMILPLVPRLYRVLPIPRRLPPEAIVVSGHVLAIVGAVGFAYSTAYWWAGLVGAFGVAMNHVCDMVDGTHARRTGQCRNGGELLDHLLDPISFSYWMIGLGVSIQSPYVAAVMVLAICATAILTGIKAKLLGRFELARLGPTEFKMLLVLWGLAASGLVFWGGGGGGEVLASESSGIAGVWMAWAPIVFVYMLAAVLVVQFVVNTVRGVMVVNREGAKPDSSEWEVGG